MKHCHKYFLSIFICLFTVEINATEKSQFPGKMSNWHGFEMYTNNGNKVVVPKKVADGKPWIWRARFFGHEPQLDVALLNKGYHLVYCNVAGLYGNSEAVKRWDEFYNYLRLEHLFADRVVLEGFSRGGLIIYNWAAKNPKKVAAIYGDAPVMDFKSWPKVNPAILKVYGFKNTAEAMAYKKNPVDQLAILAKAKIPIIHVVGDADKVVPIAENTTLAETRYTKMGGIFKVIHKPGVGHHPHSIKDPQPLVDFILKHNQGKKSLSAPKIVRDKNFTLRGDFNNSRLQFEQNKKGHVAFIGGSITEMDGYRPMVCDMLKKRFPSTKFTFTDAGISSTCSTTGAFRLVNDILTKGPVDMLFVEFAVNDDQDAVHSRQNCLRGMEGIIAQAKAHNPNVDIVITHFVNQSILKKLQKGEKPVSVQAHSDVAAHHGVSVNNLAQELADLISDDKMEWKDYGGVHPNKFGNTICATMISNALLKNWAQSLAPGAQKINPPQKALLNSKSYSRGRFLPFGDIKTDSHWQKSIPKWQKEKLGKVRKHFLETPLIHSQKVGASLSIKFTGTAIGAYILAGADSGIVSCSIDGGKPVEVDTIHRYSGFNYPRTVMFFNDLEKGEHTLNLTILKNRPGRLRKGGTALRVLHFTAN